ASWPAHRDFIEVMTTSYAHFARLCLPGMLERGWGRIIQVSSVAGLVPGGPGHTLYGASKAFLVSFTQSLAAECEGRGVKISAVCPGFTYTEFHDANQTRAIVSRLPKFMFMTSEAVVESALLALERDKTVHVPGLWNKFVVRLARSLPHGSVKAVARKIRLGPDK
ncbi:MAG: SDR family NAD(P)-dependent oxidoreductase, partial [Amphiplicatus sp.]